MPSFPRCRKKCLIVTRKPSGFSDPKLSEIILADFFKPGSIESSLTGVYNACFFCLGVSSAGMKKDLYEKLTYDLTMGFAQLLAKQNNDSEFLLKFGSYRNRFNRKGRLHWARVKGKTENDLQRLGFKHVYLFRPGLLKPTEGAKNVSPYYKWFKWMVPVVETFWSSSVCSLAQLGQAMIHVVAGEYPDEILLR